MNENDLKEALRGVRAPEGLWDAIERRLAHPPRQRKGGVGWAVAAGIAVTLGASWLALRGRGGADEVAIFHQVCGHPEKLDVRTVDFAEIRRWAAARGFEMHAAGPSAAGIELAGATHLDGGDRIAVAYRAGGAWSAVIVEPARGREAVKVPLRRTSAGLTVFEWRSGPHWYTLVTSLKVDAVRACGICHLEPGVV